MKAFLVLLLVAVAAGGLFFVLRGGESPPENGGATVVRDDDVVRTETRPEDAASALAAVGEGEGRASGVIESELKVVAPAPNDPEFATLGAGSVGL